MQAKPDIGNERTASFARCREVGIGEIQAMLAKNESDRMRGVRETILQHSDARRDPENFGIYTFTKDILEKDSLVDCYKIVFPHGIVLEQSRRTAFYRGERKLYGRSIPTLLRRLDDYVSPREKELYRLVSDMRIAEFRMFIDNFAAVQEWHWCDVLYELLAQHYGLETCWLDMTNDFEAALFFATCVWDSGEWRPLRKSDIESGEDSAYGCIFCMLGNEVGMQELELARLEAARDGGRRPTWNELPERYPYPIGYQPFLRCSWQTGYGIYMRRPAPLQESRHVEALYFRQDVGLSREVFEHMKGGKAIYPDESVSPVLGHIRGIAKATRFTWDAFRGALKRNHLYRLADEETCLRDLQGFLVDRRPIEIGDEHPWGLGSDRRRQVDARYRKMCDQGLYDLHPVVRKSLVKGYRLWAPWMIPEDSDAPGVDDMSPWVVEDDWCSSWTDRWWARMMQMVMTAQKQDF